MTFVVDAIEVRNGLPIPKKTTLDNTFKENNGATSSMKLVTDYNLSIPWWLFAVGISSAGVRSEGVARLRIADVPFRMDCSDRGRSARCGRSGLFIFDDEDPHPPAPRKAHSRRRAPVESGETVTPLPKPADPKRTALAAVAVLALLGLGIGVAFFARSTQAEPFPAETAALQSLIDDFKLEDEQHKVDPDGRVNDLWKVLASRTVRSLWQANFRCWKA